MRWREKERGVWAKMVWEGEGRRGKNQEVGKAGGSKVSGGRGRLSLSMFNGSRYML